MDHKRRKFTQFAYLMSKIVSLTILSSSADPSMLNRVALRRLPLALPARPGDTRSEAAGAAIT